MEKVYIVLVHDNKGDRPWIDRVYDNKEAAINYCDRQNRVAKATDVHYDFISEEVYYDN